MCKVQNTGFEPVTARLLDECSKPTELILPKYSWWGSNPRPRCCHGANEKLIPQT